MKKLITITLFALSLTAHAKIGDTFTDPEFGKITVKGPAFPDDGKTKYEIVNGERKAILTPQWKFVDKNNEIYFNLEKRLEKFLKQETKSESDIIKMTKAFIEGLQTLKPMRKTIYLDGYNPYMLLQYDATIKNIQRAFKYQFWDYFRKIKGTPEFEQLKQEINFSSQILDTLKLYEE
ncbi:hypothetical protein HV560_07255 [Mannheimia pernigra]|uniref:Uncharacterized protein n=1 Tax=Mannheimia pernigra TaxID=111844 RepID=A0ABD7A9E2_9PAST|nr:hypothetical protein [Mannheimia pernigra]QLB42628.1 hypothetical protein HV560_07255 [Mannheimia pernigra]